MSIILVEHLNELKRNQRTAEERLSRQENLLENLEIRLARAERQLMTWWDAWNIVQEVLDDADVSEDVRAEVKAALRRYAGSDEG